MNALSVIEEKFGASVRFYYDPSTDKLYAHGSDLTKALLFTNPSLTLSRNVWKEYRFKIAVGVGQPAWYVSEPGIYQLLFASSHPKAIDFQRWVFEEVLPKLRETGLYADPARFSSEEYQQLQKVIHERDIRIFHLDTTNQVLQNRIAYINYREQQNHKVDLMTELTRAKSEAFELEKSTKNNHKRSCAERFINNCNDIAFAFQGRMPIGECWMFFDSLKKTYESTLNTTNKSMSENLWLEWEANLEVARQSIA